MAAAAEAEELRASMEEMTMNVDSVQDRVLAEILAHNAGTEYLRNCGLPTDRASFRAKVPVVSYDDLKPYILRIANGDRSPILTTLPVTDLITSSGTSSGECKLFPGIHDTGALRRLVSFLMLNMKSHFPGLDKGKALYFFFVRPETKTTGGLTVWLLMTRTIKSEEFSNVLSSHPFFDYTSPLAAILCPDTVQSMYAQMVCALCQRHDVLRVGTLFASSLLRAIHFLQLNWEELAADIEAGTLGPRVTDESVREAVAGVLVRPDPELARFLREECGDGEWAGIIARIWPNTRYLDVIITGAMAQYVPTLRHYSGGLPMVSSTYASAECYFGVNLRPLCDPSEVSYTIMPSLAYFEFLPVEADASGQEQLVDLARVEEGREYEIVVTTLAGLNRYRVGDVLRVSGFHNDAPQFQFVRRSNVLLCLEMDKTDEADLQRAVDRASALLRPHASVLEYTSRTCTERIPGHYVIYWELLPMTGGGVAVDRETLEGCCLEMEEALNPFYRGGRVDGTIGPLEIRVVRPGTFDELMDNTLTRGGSITQYKAPRCVTLPPVIQLLESRVVSVHFSTTLPSWNPTRPYK